MSGANGGEGLQSRLRHPQEDLPAAAQGDTAGSIDMAGRCAFALAVAKKAGADFADAMVAGGRSTSVKVRLGNVIEVVQSRDQGLGIRVLVAGDGGLKTATTSTSDLGDEAIERLVTAAVAMARRTAADPFAGPPESGFEPEPGAPIDLETWDDEVYRLDPDRALQMALATEAAALGVDARFTNSEGGEMSWGYSELHVTDSNGRGRGKRATSASLWTTPVAEDGPGKQRDYWWTSGRWLADLESPDSVGKKAAARTLRRLGARKPETAEVPVIFEAPIASGLLGSISGAANGGAIYRDSSWLCGKLGQTIAASGVTLVDNPWIVRGAASRLFDGEGLATRPMTLVEAGVLKTWVLDTYSGKKLGLPSTRSAWRGLGGSPSPGTSNLWMNNGDESLEALIAGTKTGLFVTGTVGGGANTVTGDFSQGVVGLWIEDGKIAYPVEEITIASTLAAMWSAVDGIASDRHPGRATSAPSFRIGKMTVAGR